MDIQFYNKLGKESLFKISCFKTKIKRTKPHKHEGYNEIILISKGKGVHHVDTEMYEINPPQAYLLRNGQVHCWEFTEIPEGYVLMFKEEFLLQYASVARLLEGFEERNLYELRPEEHQDIRKLMDSIFEEAGNQQLFGNEILASYLNILLLKFRRFEHYKGKENVVFEREIARSFRQMLEENFSEIRQVKKYAEMLNVTPKKLNSICREVLGKPALEVVHGRIDLEAKRLLLHTDLSVSEISYKLNFTDTSHFVKFFKKVNEVSPGDYRHLLSQ
ncbi:helix-turn-helix transcriptional regulator [Cytophagaceae bacterium ABcell3]|nr:helix-turn-helix transcriptional regulator [Cytophagaceae bacterium ABcell3]